MTTNYGARPGLTVEPELCACGCGRPLGTDECANERGEHSGVRAECWAAYCADNAARSEDEAVDRAQEREAWREWGGRP